MALFASAALGAAVWCLAVATIAALERLARPVFGWALALLSLAMVPALVGLWALRDDTSAAGSFAAFCCAVVAWAWHELACAPYRGRRRGGFALETHPAHELAWALFVLAVAVLTWEGHNLAARLTLPALWALHGSMRLNQFASERASEKGPLVRPPWFAPGLPAAQWWSALFPLAVTALTAAVTLATEAALAHGSTSWALLAGLGVSGTLAHWRIVVRFAWQGHLERLRPRVESFRSWWWVGFREG
jgi:putative photosynthetic complex assembly protein 2